ncbi:hypothetical protein D3C85_904670 [compost metagenome]
MGQQGRQQGDIAVFRAAGGRRRRHFRRRFFGCGASRPGHLFRRSGRWRWRFQRLAQHIAGVCGTRVTGSGSGDSGCRAGIEHVAQALLRYGGGRRLVMDAGDGRRRFHGGGRGGGDGQGNRRRQPIVVSSPFSALSQPDASGHQQQQRGPRSHALAQGQPATPAPGGRAGIATLERGQDAVTVGLRLLRLRQQAGPGREPGAIVMSSQNVRSCNICKTLRYSTKS